MLTKLKEVRSKARADFARITVLRVSKALHGAFHARDPDARRAKQ
jgi:hypothetical protein